MGSASKNKNSISQDMSRISIASWNCNGLKSSMDYALKLSNQQQITFISEHWLLPHEIPAIKDKFLDHGKTALLSSSVDPLLPLKGRPYGGTGFLCDSKCGLSFQLQECDSKRILGLKVYKNQKLLLVIYGLYLPYENHTLEQMELYMETLDNLKSLMESTVAQCPMLIVGDMNTSLPTSETLDSGWYKKHPFSKRSLILYDFFM